MANELPFVLANRTSWRRLRGLAKLCPALYADKVLHRPPNLVPQPPRRTGESMVTSLTDVNRGCDRARSDRKTDHLPGAGLSPHRESRVRRAADFRCIPPCQRP